MKRSWMFALLAPFALSACLSAEDPPADDDDTDDLIGLPLLLGSAEAGAVEVQLFTDEALHVGLNDIYYRVKKNNDVVTTATLTQLPMMNMVNMGMEHSCPHEQPAATADERGLYAAKVVFIMESSTEGDKAGEWRLELDVDLGGGAAAQEVTFANVPVVASTARKDLMVPGGMGGATVPVVITLNFAAPPKVGQNPFTLTVHKQAQMGMVWEPMSDWSAKVTPVMPTMGHGSPGNVQPKHVAAGRFDGSVNLTMGGLWQITFDFKDSGAAAMGTVKYELTL